MTTFSDFLLWEHSTRDIIDFKKIYVDMTGDVLAGLVLSEIVYWHLPKQNGESRLRVQKKGHDWIACKRAEWWDRTRLTPRQIDRVLKILVSKGLIVKSVFKFSGLPTTHIRLIQDAFIGAWEAVVKNPIPNPYAKSPNGDNQITISLEGINANGNNVITENVKTLTETTTETPTEKKKTQSDKQIEITIKAWLDGQIAKPATNQYRNKGVRSNAKDIATAGFTPEQVTAFVKANAAKEYWRGKLVPIGYVANNIAAHFAAFPRIVPEIEIVPATPPPDDTPATPEQIEQARAMFAALVKSKAG